MSSEPKPKVYIEILNQLQKMMSEDGLTAGDKLPSERELSERLHAGRSSVREALRALELLGLIETRRGEGTFIKDAGGHQLVQLIGTFILQNEKAQKDLIELEGILELNAIGLAVKRMTDADLLVLKRTVSESYNSDILHKVFFDRIFKASENWLLERIWLVLVEYIQMVTPNPSDKSISFYEKLINAIESKDLATINALYTTCD